MASPAQSQLYVGTVRHRRFTPVQHALNYPLFMPAIDLDELETLQQSVWGFGQRWWHWARWKRSDYLGSGDLKTAVQEKVRQLTGVDCQGKVIAVCHLRYLGLYFSPVNFYYLHDAEGNWRYMLAEVSNTPWNERHYYAVSANQDDQTYGWTQQKAFHVSPFNPIDQQYQWRLKPLGDHLSVHLECHKGEKHFDATMAMKALPFNSKNLVKQLIKMPSQTVKVVFGIYWHALKLWLKGAPFYSHPKYQSDSHPDKQTSATETKNKEHKENSAC